MNAEEFVDRLEGQKNYSGGNWQVRCPAHTDHVQSLSVTDGEDRVLFYCHAGCYWKDVIKAMGIEPRDLFHNQEMPLFNEGRATYMQQPEAIYKYKNPDGSLAYEVVRFPNKQFRQRRFSDGGMVWNMDGIKKIPYNLNEISFGLPGETIYIVEGEKDVETLRGTVLATCFVGGAGRNKFLARYVKWFQNFHVVIVMDDDGPGKQYAEEIADALDGVARSVKIVKAKKGKDVTDHINAGYTVDQLVETE